MFRYTLTLFNERVPTDHQQQLVCLWTKVRTRDNPRLLNRRSTCMSCGVAGFTVFTARRIAGGIRYRNYFRPSACAISPSSCTSHSLSVKEAEIFLRQLRPSLASLQIFSWKLILCKISKLAKNEFSRDYSLLDEFFSGFRWIVRTDKSSTCVFPITGNLISN